MYNLSANEKKVLNQEKQESQTDRIKHNTAMLNKLPFILKEVYEGENYMYQNFLKKQPPERYDDFEHWLVHLEKSTIRKLYNTWYDEQVRTTTDYIEKALLKKYHNKTDIIFFLEKFKGLKQTQKTDLRYIGIDGKERTKKGVRCYGEHLVIYVIDTIDGATKAVDKGKVLNSVICKLINDIDEKGTPFSNLLEFIEELSELVDNDELDKSVALMAVEKMMKEFNLHTDEDESIKLWNKVVSNKRINT
ncbi:MAG TPA: hypothetical protein VK121_01410 [Pseudogracilibacillus sp.]|nr:hypothetical protein [Pseudogracilibacillus sp.]